jgi:hypothetical protein
MSNYSVQDTTSVIQAACAILQALSICGGIIFWSIYHFYYKMRTKKLHENIRKIIKNFFLSKEKYLILKYENNDKFFNNNKPPKSLLDSIGEHYCLEYNEITKKELKEKLKIININNGSLTHFTKDSGIATCILEELEEFGKLRKKIYEVDESRLPNDPEYHVYSSRVGEDGIVKNIIIEKSRC